MPSSQLQVSGKSHWGGKAEGKDQYSGPKLINKLHVDVVASCTVHQVSLEHIHIPLRHLSFLLNTHSCPFPRVLVSVRTICEGPGVYYIAALGTSFCLSPFQTLHRQAPDSPTGHFTGMISNSGMTNRGNFVPWGSHILCCYRRSKSLSTG